MATVNSLALEILQDIDKATDDTGLISRTETRVNNALDAIAVATNWNSFHTRTTLATVATQSQYSMPQGAREIIQLRYPDTGEPITFITPQEVARRGIKLEDPGRASLWLEDGVVVSGANVLLRIRLAPVPASILNFEVEYYYHPSETASGSVLPIQDQHVTLVKDHVLSRLYEIDQKYDASDRCWKRYLSNLEPLIKKEMRKVASQTVLKQTDLTNIRRRGRPLFDPSHFNNGFG